MPLIKGKSARQTLKEKGLWGEYRKKHPYNPTAKFDASGSEAMTNDADVSTDEREAIDFVDVEENIPLTLFF